MAYSAADKTVFTEWTVRDATLAATQGLATKAAESGATHYVTMIDGSYDTAQIGLLEVVEDVGGTPVVRWAGWAHSALPRNFKPIKITKGASVSGRLQAGAGGVIGDVTIGS